MALQKGIIESIEDQFTVKVRIPRYDKISSDPYGTKTSDLATAVICSIPGAKISYSVGDVVLVDFENDELAKPVILGLLYKETGDNATLEMPEIDYRIEELDSQLSSLQERELFTHTKYSNDNGITFTSLLDKVTPTKDSIEDILILSAKGIEIDNQSSVVIWSALHDNMNRIDRFNITTTLTGYDYYDVTNSFTTTESIINIPVNFKGLQKIILDYSLSIPTLDYDLEDYYITLVTDTDEIGTIPGNYIGTYVSNSDIPSDTPSDYSWVLSSSTTEEHIENINDKIYAQNEHIKELDKIVNDNVQYLEEDKTLTLGADSNIIYLDSTREKYIDNIRNTIVTPQLNINPFIQKITKIDNEYHLQLFYNGNLVRRNEDELGV